MLGVLFVTEDEIMNSLLLLIVAWSFTGDTIMVFQIWFNIEPSNVLSPVWPGLNNCLLDPLEQT